MQHLVMQDPRLATQRNTPDAARNAGKMRQARDGPDTTAHTRTRARAAASAGSSSRRCEYPEYPAGGSTPEYPRVGMRDLQPEHGLEVEVVRRLVQQQQVGLVVQRL